VNNIPLKRLCRKRDHLNAHSNLHKRWCEFCNSFVVVNDIKRGRKCNCCNSPTLPKKKYYHQHEKNILNKGINELGDIVELIKNSPIISKDVKIMVRIYYKRFTYQIPLTALIRYNESYNNCFVGDNCEFWTEEMIYDQSLFNQLKIATNKMELLGIGR